MKTSLARLVLTSALYVLTMLAAQADSGFFALEIGGGEIDIDETDQLPFDPLGDTDDDAVAFSVGGGFLFSSGLYIEFAYTDLDTVTLFGLDDLFEFSTIKTGIGYKISMNESFSFLAEAGLSFWDLAVRESFFLNPGPESSGGFDGTDVYFELGAEYAFGDRFAITLVHTRDTHDLGDARATRLGMRYYFDAN